MPEKGFKNYLLCDDIVISGVGGRFPRSDSVDELAENLYNNVDMVTDDTDGERWPNGLFGMNPRMGKLKNIDKFDGNFFGLLGQVADAMDPQSRILLETAFETIVDSGFTPQQLRGSNTGVYIAMSTWGLFDGVPSELQNESRQEVNQTFEWLLSTAKSNYPTRIQSCFDFRGPTFFIDTACSSSICALDLAVADLRLGKCDRAIVAGAHVILQPFTNKISQEFGFNSRSGFIRPWDVDGDGYVRGETIAGLFLQRKSEAKRIYATIIHSKTNNDGFKPKGFLYPNREQQIKLMKTVYTEAGINPKDINYIEAHGTGTDAGDLEESNAICDTFKDNGEIFIGLVKGSIGHSEGASGTAAIIKTIIAMENQCLPANLNLKQLKPHIAAHCPPLNPVKCNTKFKPKIVAVNNFGIGGTNAHVLLKGNEKEMRKESLKIVDDEIPARLVNVCGRTQESVEFIFDFIRKNPTKVTCEFLALLNEFSKYKIEPNTAGMPFRGSMMIKKQDDGELTYTSECSKLIGNNRKQVWFFFSGMGSQWVGMAKEMIKIKLFAKTIKKCHNFLQKYGIDLMQIIASDSRDALESIINPFVAITSIQIALFDVLTSLGIFPDQIIGHSFGEIACGYADGCLTLEQALLCAYWRGKVVEDSTLPSGAMAAVGLGAEAIKSRLPKNVFLACDNTPNSVTISGLEKNVVEFVKQLESENVFVRRVAGYQLKPYHTEMLEPIENVSKKILGQFISEPRPRSSKWLSTSIDESDVDKDELKFASPDYFVNNMMTPVFLASVLKQVPDDAVVIEIAPHELFKNLIKRSFSSINYIGLMKRNNTTSNAEMFLSSIAKLYQLGLDMTIENLYPKVEWPVPRGTQSLSSLIKWDHSKSYFVKKWPEFYCHSTASDVTFRFSLDNPEHQFLRDHAVDGRLIFPGAGYLVLAWRRLAAVRDQPWQSFPVTFENVEFKRSVMFDENGRLKLTVRYLNPTGQFVILDSANVAVTGRIYVPEDEEALKLQHLLKEEIQDDESTIELNEDEFYKELYTRGYEYGPNFRGTRSAKIINSVNSNTSIRMIETNIEWSDKIDFISLLDNAMQSIIPPLPGRLLFYPSSISMFRCDPRMFYESKRANKQLNIDRFYSHPSNSLEEASVIKNIIKSLITVRHLIDSRIIVSNGLEFVDVQYKQVQRRPITNGLRIERYEFVPYFEDRAIDIGYNNELQSYVDVCVCLCKKLKNWLDCDSQEIEKVFNGNLKGEEVNGDNQNMKTDNVKNEQVMLKILNFLCEAIDNHQHIDINDLKDILKKIKNIPEFDISKDMVNLVGRNERLLRPFLDLVNENIGSRELKVAEINLSQGIIWNDIKNFIAETFIFPISVNYTVVNDQPELITKTSELSINKWTGESKFPNDIEQLDLLIHRDTDKMWDIEINEYLKNAKKAIKSGGFLLAIFKIKQTAPEMIISKLKNGKVIRSDDDRTLRFETFKNKAIENGFTVVSKKSDGIMFEAILFRSNYQQSPDPKCQIVVPVKTGCYNEWIEAVKEAIQTQTDSENTRIWLLADDSEFNGIIGFAASLRLEYNGKKIRFIFDSQNKLPKPVNFTKSPYAEMLEKDLISNIYKQEKFGSMRFINLPLDNQQVLRQQAYVNIQHPGDLSTLCWIDGHNMPEQFFISKEIENQIKTVECDIYVSALNFRDAMIATGKMQPFVEEIQNNCHLGMEFAGRRCDTGQRVFGLTLGAGIATHVRVNDAVVFSVPDRWSMEEAATAGIVYMTVWQGLVKRGRLSNGETVLIHSASGGVGQAALNVCQHYNSQVFVTVGSKEKREFLKKNYGLNDEQIFSSKTTEFVDKIIAATQGRGVDLVLNSLTGDCLLAGLGCLAKYGRFIEIGRFDLIQNRQLPMSVFLKNITFYSIAIDRTFHLKSQFDLNTLKAFGIWFQKGVETGFIKPINRTVFSVDGVQQAFKYFTSGRHTGKVLIKIRDEKTSTIQKEKTPALEMLTTPKTWFDSSKVYIIIGGLGRMGLEMAYWMATRGAKKFVFTSTSGIKTEFQRFLINKLKEMIEMRPGKSSLKIIKENGIDLTSAEKIISLAQEAGPIGGVFQLALISHDALISEQTVETFNKVCQAKVEVTINMDKLTRDLNSVDYFVVFSSMACGRGNSGQSPYGYGNSVAERVCEKRQRDGLHGLAIEWGAIGDIKVQAAAFFAFNGEPLHSWTNALECFLSNPIQYPVVASSIRAEAVEIAGRSIEENYVNQLWSLMGVDPKTVDSDVTLEELGIDSFVVVELQQKLEKDYDIIMTLNHLKKLTVGEIKEFQKGNRDHFKKLAGSINLTKTRLSLLNWSLISTEPITSLNKVYSKNNPIYFLPQINGLFDRILPLAQALPYPVYGINWTPKFKKFKSLNEISQHYLSFFNNLNHNVNIVGWFFSSTLAVQLFLDHVKFDNMFIIDPISTGNKNKGNDQNLIDIVIQTMFADIPDIIVGKIKESIKKWDDQEAIVKKLVDAMKFYGAASTGNGLEKVVTETITRAKIMMNCCEEVNRLVDSLKNNSKGKIVLFKSNANSNPNVKQQTGFKELEKSGLNNLLTDGIYQLHTVIGSTNEILNLNVNETVNIIKECIEKID